MNPEGEISMRCPTCLRPVPDDRLACPHCASARSYQAILDFQKHFVKRIEKGELMVALTKSAAEYRWHMVLANYPQAWCGRALNARWKKRRLAWPKIDAATEVCGDCRRVFGEIAEDRTAEVA
jgi:hypothetical protein